MPLTDAACRNAKPGPKVRKLTDSHCLQLWVRPSGTKSWVYAYRHGGQKTYTIGTYPLFSLAEARQKRDEAAKLLMANTDPSAAKKAAKRAQSVGETFDAIAEEYIAKMHREGRAEATLTKTRWLLGKARPALGNMKIDAITPSDVLHVLRKVEQRKLYDTAHRLRAVIGTVCRYASQTARADNDPTVRLRGALTKKPATQRPALTSPRDLGGFLRALDDFTGQATTKAALQLLVMLFPRPGELRKAEWTEFDFASRKWTIPACRMKCRIEHQIPLPGAAIEILQNLKALALSRRYVFPSVRSSNVPMSEGTLNAALRQMGYAKNQVTAHGFRATGSTFLNQSNLWHLDAVERHLAHGDPDTSRARYDRSMRWQERVEMLTWYADQLERLKWRGTFLSLAPAAPTSGKREYSN